MVAALLVAACDKDVGNDLAMRVDTLNRQVATLTQEQERLTRTVQELDNDVRAYRRDLARLRDETNQIAARAADTGVVDERIAAIERQLTGPVTPADGPGRATDAGGSTDEPVQQASAVPPAGGIGVHLASYRSRANAQAGWATLSGRHGDLLGGLAAQLETLDLGEFGGQYYRLKAGPLADDQTARSLCAALRARQVYCEVSQLDAAAAEPLTQP